jgi:mRNA interferase HigB
VFNIIARKTLLDYCAQYPGAAKALQEWYHELLRSEDRSFNELKQRYPTVSLVGDDRAVFNILGNRFRLVVRVVFEYRVIQIKWFGMHAEYDRISVKEVKYKKQ